MAAGVTNPFAKRATNDYLQFLEPDDLTKELYEAKKIQDNLKKQISEVKEKVQKCLSIIKINEQGGLEDLFQDSDDQKNYSLQESHELSKFSELQDRVSTHRLLGSECLSLTDNRFNFVIHCYEDAYPTLPLKIFQIEHLKKQFYRIMPKTLSYYIGCDEALRDLMVKSTRSQVSLCLQKIQSLTFDLVMRDNVYQSLKSLPIISKFLSCDRTRKTISIVLPITSPTQSQVGLVSQFSLLSNNIRIILQSPEADTDYKWGGEVLTHKIPSSDIPPRMVSLLSSFIDNLRQMSVLEAIKILLDNAFSASASPTSSKSGESDEFRIGIF